MQLKKILAALVVGVGILTFNAAQAEPTALRVCSPDDIAPNGETICSWETWTPGQDRNVQVTIQNPEKDKLIIGHCVFRSTNPFKSIALVWGTKHAAVLSGGGKDFKFLISYNPLAPGKEGQQNILFYPTGTPNPEDTLNCDFMPAG